MEGKNKKKSMEKCLSKIHHYMENNYGLELVF